MSEDVRIQVMEYFSMLASGAPVAEIEAAIERIKAMERGSAGSACAWLEAT